MLPLVEGVHPHADFTNKDLHVKHVVGRVEVLPLRGYGSVTGRRSHHTVPGEMALALALEEPPERWRLSGQQGSHGGSVGGVATPMRPRVGHGSLFAQGGERVVVWEGKIVGPCVR